MIRKLFLVILLANACYACSQEAPVHQEPSAETISVKVMTLLRDAVRQVKERSSAEELPDFSQYVDVKDKKGCLFQVHESQRQASE
ncbi:MAG: hypothetical protein WBN40_01915 [Pseudomonadales bacterium]